MLKTNDEAKKKLEKIVGLSRHEILEMAVCEFDKKLSRKAGKKIEVVARSDKRLLGRGSPLITKRRLRYIKETDKKIKKIKL